MSDAQQFLLATDKDQAEATQIAQRVAQRIEAKDVKLIEVVQSVGEYLTDDDATIRAKSIAYLAAVLGALAPETLTRQQVGVVRQFLCDRVEDASGLKESAQGLTALEKCKRFTSEDAQEVVRALFTSAQDLQRHPQGTRFVVLTLLNSIMSDHRATLQYMGSAFVIGITDLVSGEKDPRNLMIVFSMLRVVMIEFDISSYVETMFDSVFCYFPITFRPPPDDPYGITAQDLKDRLRSCIASTQSLAEYSFPALIDKLDSTSPNVKKDVLQTLAACALSYDISVIVPRSTSLWDAVKFEVFNAQEDDLASEALLVVKAIATHLSKYWDNPLESPLSKYIKTITTECNEKLQEPQQKQAKQAGQVLASVATASPIAFTFVIRDVLPPIFTLYQDRDTLGKQRALLEVINQLLESATEVYGIVGTTDPTPSLENPLDSFQDRLFELYSRALMGTSKEEVSFRVVALKGLLQITKLRNFLSSSEIGLVVQYLDEIVLVEESYGTDEIKEQAVKALVEISKLDYRVIMEITFPAFMSKLPDTSVPESNYITVLEGLAKLSVDKDVFELLYRRLFSKFDVVIRQDVSNIYPHAILSALIYVIEQNGLRQNVEWAVYARRLVNGPIQKTLEADSSSLIRDRVLSEDLGRLLTITVRQIDLKEHQKILDEVYSVLVPSLESNSTDRDTSSTIFLTALLAGLHPSVKLPRSPAELLTVSATESCTNTVGASIEALNQQLALLTNKWFSAKDETFIAPINDKLFSKIELATVEPRQARQAIISLLHIVKGLSLRLDPATFRLLDRVVPLISDPTHGTTTAQAFGLLLSPSSLLTKANFCTIRLLHAQRLFMYVLPSLSAAFKPNTAPEIKTNYLIALAGLLPHVPSSVILPQAATLIPLLLQGVDSSDAKVKSASISTLQVLCVEKLSAVEEHVGSLVSRLLRAARKKGEDRMDSNPPAVRLASLRCLRGFPAEFRRETLLPYKKAVVRGLTDALDDGKRAVRKEGVDCRRAWLELDEVDDDD